MLLWYPEKLKMLSVQDLGSDFAELASRFPFDGRGGVVMEISSVMEVSIDKCDFDFCQYQNPNRFGDT